MSATQLPLDPPPAIELKNVTVCFPHERSMRGVLGQSKLLRGVIKLLPGAEAHLVRKSVLSAASFTVARGRIHGILGVNGAGKSTTLATIAGLILPTEGEVLIHGVPVTADNDVVRRYVSKCNRAELYDDFTALENIEFVARLYDLEVKPALVFAEALLTQLGVTADDIGRLASSLSFGTKMKVALVRAILPLFVQSVIAGPVDDGKILLLDEPTAGLDVIAKETVFGIIDRLRRMLPGLTVVIATNDPLEAGLCESYTAITGGEVRSGAKELESLRGLMRSAREAADVVGQLIGAGVENGMHVEGPLPIPPGGLPKSEKPTAAKSFEARHWRSVRKNMLVTVAVVSTLVLPNFLGMFANSGRPLRALLGSALGIFAALVIRESLRFLDRERSHYRTLETILLSPLKRWEHVRATALCGVKVEAITALITLGVCVLLFCLPGIGGAGPAIAAQLASSVAQISWADVIGLSALAAIVVLTAWVMGFLVSLLPFLSRGDHSFFLASAVPLLAVTLGGIHSDVTKLPNALALAAQLNPLTYAANALRSFAHIDAPPLLTAEKWVVDLMGVEQGWGSLLVLSALTTCLVVWAVLTYRPLERLVMRAGRLRNG